MEKTERALLMIVSAPSGAGKTTLCHKLLEAIPALHYSVSCTTRASRGNEVDGESYFFMSEDDFNVRIENNDFLEYARVHGAWYGTLRKTITDQLKEGRHVLMDIDIQGAAQIRQCVEHADPFDPIRRGYLDVFIAPPSMEDLEERLCGRGEDPSDVIARRLINARDEMRHWDEYQYLVVNDELDEALSQLHSIITAETCRIL